MNVYYEGVTRTWVKFTPHMTIGALKESIMDKIKSDDKLSDKKGISQLKIDEIDVIVAGEKAEFNKTCIDYELPRLGCIHVVIKNKYN